MANPEPAISSSLRSGSVSTNSRRHSGFAREMACAAGPVCQTLRNQTQSNPCAARRSNAASGTSSSSRGPAQRPGQFRQPDAGIDLVKRGIATGGHISLLNFACLRSPPTCSLTSRRIPARSRAPGLWRRCARTGREGERPNRSTLSGGWRRAPLRCHPGNIHRRGSDRASADRPGTWRSRRRPAARACSVARAGTCSPGGARSPRATSNSVM